jgi:hypothetical protein
MELDQETAEPLNVGSQPPAGLDTRPDTEESPISLNAFLEYEAAEEQIDWSAQLKGLGIEGVGSVGGTAATLRAMKTQRGMKALNYLSKLRRLGQATAIAGAGGPQAAEPVSTTIGLGTVLITEGLWSVGSNWMKQEYFKSLGIQENTSAGELITSGLLLSPIIHQGRKIPKLGSIFEPSMLKTRTFKVGAYTVQGALVGAVESSLRQTWDLMAAEDKSLSDFSFTDLRNGIVFGAGLGGGGGTTVEAFDGLKMLNIYRKVVQRNKVTMTGNLEKDLARLRRSLEINRRINDSRLYAQTRKLNEQIKQKQEELNQINAIHDEVDETLEDIGDTIDSRRNAASGAEDVPEPTPTPEPESAPKDVPEEEFITVYRGGAVNPDSPLTYTTANKDQASAYSEGKTETAFDAETQADADQILTFKVNKNKIASEEEVRETLEELGFPQTKESDENYIGGMIHEYLDPEFKGEGFYLGDGVDARLAKALKDKGFDAYRARGNDAGGGTTRSVEEVVLLKKEADPDAPTGQGEIEQPIEPKNAFFRPIFKAYADLINNKDRGVAGTKTQELKQVFLKQSELFGDAAGKFLRDPSPENLEQLDSIIDDYIALDRYDARLKQLQGQSLKGQSGNETINFDRALKPERAKRQEALKNVKEKVEAMKRDQDFESIDQLIKEADEALEASKPPAKKKKPTPPEQRTTSQKIEDTQKRLIVLKKLIEGGDVEEIKKVLGKPRKKVVKTASQKKLSSLLKQENELKRVLREKQSREVLRDMHNVFDPRNEMRSFIDITVDAALAARTASLLNQPTTMTTGLPSGAIAYFTRLTKNTISNTIEVLNFRNGKFDGTGVGGRLTYAASELLATLDQMMSFAHNIHPTWINMKETFANGGNSAFLYRDGNKIVENSGSLDGINAISAREQRLQRQMRLREQAELAENFLMKGAYKTLGSNVFEKIHTLYFLGRTMLGTFDEPFVLAMTNRGNKAAAFREAIVTKPDNPAEFIQKYIDGASKVDDRGVTRFNYFDEKYNLVANQTRRGLFRRADYEKGDYRLNNSERFADFANQLFGRNVFMNIIGALTAPFRTTPIIGLGQNIGNLIAPGKVPAKLVGEFSYVLQRLITPNKTTSSIDPINKQISEIEIQIKDLRAKVNEDVDISISDEKLEALRKKNPEKAEEIDNARDLAEKLDELRKVKDFKSATMREDIAQAIMTLSVMGVAWHMTGFGMLTGNGAAFTDEQRKRIQKLRAKIGETEDGRDITMNYRLFEQYRSVLSVTSDLKMYFMLEEEGLLTEDQKGFAGFMNFTIATIRSTLTDAPFTQGLKQLDDLFLDPNPDTKIRAGTQIMSSFTGVPSAIRGANLLDDDVYYDHSAGLDLENFGSRALKSSLGLESPNARINKFGKPIERFDKSVPLASYIFRYAPEEVPRKLERDNAIYQIELNDSVSFGILSDFPVSRTIDGVSINFKKFNRGGQTLQSYLAELVHEGDKQFDEIYKYIQSDRFEIQYNNGEYYQKPNDDEYTNDALEKINAIKKKYFDRALTKLEKDKSGPLQYFTDGELNVFEYIEEQKNQPEKPSKATDVINTFSF